MVDSADASFKRAEIAARHGDSDAGFTRSSEEGNGAATRIAGNRDAFRIYR